MNIDQRCSKCGKVMKRIPIKRLDSRIIIEYYCDKCDESFTYYPDIGELKFNKPKVF